MTPLLFTLCLAILVFPTGGVASDTASSERSARLVPQLGHTGGIYSLAFSPDGRLLASQGGRQVVLWHVETGAELRRFDGTLTHAVVFSRDGKTLLIGFEDAVARLFDSTTGALLREFAGHESGKHETSPRNFLVYSGAVTAVAFSPSADRIATGSTDGTARVWNLKSGDQVLRVAGDTTRIRAVAFSPDGKALLTADAKHGVRRWNASSGGLERTLEVQSRAVFSPDGERVVGARDRKDVLGVFDASSGSELHQLAARSGPVAFSWKRGHLLTGALSTWDRAPDGSPINARKPVLRLWGAETGQLIREYEANARATAAAFSPDGRVIAAAIRYEDRGPVIQLWDTESGQSLRRILGRVELAPRAALSPDGTRMLVAPYFSAVELWNLESGRRVDRFTGSSPRDFGKSVAFARDGRHFAIGRAGAVEVWTSDSLEMVNRFKESRNHRVTALDFGPAGELLSTQTLWDTNSGQAHDVHCGSGGRHRGRNRVALSPDGKRVVCQGRLFDRTQSVALGERMDSSFAFSPDGRFLLEGDQRGRLELRDAEKLFEGFEGWKHPPVRTFKGHEKDIVALAFSPDGKRAISGSEDQTARIWNVTTGEQLVRLEHSGALSSVAFTPDGRHVVTAGSIAVTFWDAATGRERARLISFRGGSWAVVDPEGRFDASSGGDVEGLAWVVGTEPIELVQLKDRFYEPGLLAKLLGHDDEPLRDVRGLGDVALYPEVTVEPDPENPTRLLIRLRNRGGGLGPVVVRVNGREVRSDARPRGSDPDANELTLHVDLSGEQLLLRGEDNQVEVWAYNEQEYLRSLGLAVTVRPDGEKPAEDEPAFFGIVVGVSDYAGSKGGELADLSYAAKDAESIVDALRLGASRLFGPKNVHIQLLSTDREDETEQPTRANLERAFAELMRAEPDPRNDVLVVYLAGHGVTHGGVEGDYYFLTMDARTARLTDPALRARTAVSSTELMGMLREVPIRKQVLILDACAAGVLVERLTEARAAPGESVRRRAFERMKDRVGLHVLAAATSDAASYEASPYAQGLLTYSLLEGMRGAAIDDVDELLSVVPLFEYAARRVPRLAQDLAAVQTPTVASPHGGLSFELGRLTPADRARIPLAEPRPLVFQSLFVAEGPAPRDTLRITRDVNQTLRERSARGSDGNFVYVDNAYPLPGAYQLTGRYSTSGKRIDVEVFVLRDDAQLASFELQGGADDRASLAAAIVDRASEFVRR